MKKVLILFLVVAILCSMFISVMAADDPDPNRVIKIVADDPDPNVIKPVVIIAADDPDPNIIKRI